jgi:spore maturation protein CgeB/glycosyltransferase involved in cell wall biosynthesis/SAM-dependent methyltransferase
MSVDIIDRVYDAYAGELGQKLMRDTQRRIHWMCTAVRGRSVLDVGCSQGLIPILLGREGRNVVGIDNSASAIRSAEQHLASEPTSVRKLVSFVEGDFATHPLPDAAFDCIVMGEVLEHLVDPERFVARAARHLGPGGCLVVTVPFGINDHVDHKRTYYLLEPYRLLSPAFDVVEVTLLGKWLGLVGVRRNEREATPATLWTDADLARLEQAFERVERALLDDLSATRSKLDDANTKYRASTEDVARWKREAAHHEAERKSAERQRAQADAQGQAPTPEPITAELARLRDELGNERRARHDSELVRVRLEERLTHAEQLKLLEQQVKDVEREGLAAKHAVLTRELEDTSARLVQLEQAHRPLRAARDEERAAHAGLTQQLQESAAEARELSRELKERELLLASERTEVIAARRSEARLKAELARILEANQASEQRAAEHAAQVAALCEQLRAQEQALSEQAASEHAARAEAQKAKDNAAFQATLERELRALRDRSNELERSLASQRIMLRASESKAEQLKNELETLRAAERRTRAQLDAERRERMNAERRAVQARNTISFQLGYELIHGFKSRRALAALPKSLWHLQQEAARRRRERTDKHRVPVRSIALESEPHAPAVPQAPPPVRLPEARPTSAEAPPPSEPAQHVPRELRQARIACIHDEFTFSSFAPECELLQLTPGGWREEISTFRPHLLFVESAWRGKNDQWARKVAHRAQELMDLVAWCRSQGIPSVFWNKEDPVHYRTFLNTAKLFDAVFTTDIDCIPRYKRALGHERVYLLPFAVQPKAHNPLEKYERKDAIAFAGAYYARYPERQADLAGFADHFQHAPRLEIFDRNHGKSDPDYQFPERYRHHIVGTLPFDQIDKAYKGYRFALNLNSIKTSQTMFARRVFELLGSNTITVSNFSRGVRLMFGDLVIATDNGARAQARLQQLMADESLSRRLRLAGLRKVLLEHTYEQRLRDVAERVWGRRFASAAPGICVVAAIATRAEGEAVVASFQRQSYQDKQLVLLCSDNLELAGHAKLPNVTCLSRSAAQARSLSSLAANATHLAGFSSRDHYGANYLMDLALATLYSPAQVIGKGARFRTGSSKGVSLLHDGAQYRVTRSLPARAAMISRAALPNVSAVAWLERLETQVFDGAEALSIDEFNYCEEGTASSIEDLGAVDDLPGLDRGLALADLVRACDGHATPPEETPPTRPQIDAVKLASLFKPAPGKPLALSVEGEHLLLQSALPDETHEYLYAREAWKPGDLGLPEGGKLHFEAGPGLNVQLAVLFLDADKQRLGHKLCLPGVNETLAPPERTASVQLALRVYGAGSAKIGGVLLDHLRDAPDTLFGRGKYLLVTNRYPSDGDLYRNGFVHRRVLEYIRHGERIDVFRLGGSDKLGYHEFDGVDVTTGGTSALDALLRSNDYRAILVHFLDPRMWQSIAPWLGKRKVLIWAHGAEIQAWHRRAAHFATPAALAAAQAEGEPRKQFWRGVARDLPKGSKVIFVSRHFADEVLADLELALPLDRQEVIHNVIDTSLFAYRPKIAEQRKRILSIRPYTSRIYANDLAVAAILALSDRPYFSELEFRLVGDGPLFEETVAPLRGLPNVRLDRRFFTQHEIAALHAEYGVFLCPTRGDTQGVSRDEAMSSGLVPVTTVAGAIPEFVDADCGVLAGADDALGLAAGLAKLYEDPALFLRLSAQAAARVRRQSGPERTTRRELELIREVDQA